MKKTILLTTFFMGLGVSAHATPLISQGGSQTLTIESTSYTITDRADSPAQDTWQPSYGYTGSDYTGVYLGTIDGNDSTTDLENLIGYFLDNSSYVISEYAKMAYDDGTNNWSNDGGTDGLVSVTTTDDGLSGTWTATSPYVLDFYTVKSSTEFALYSVNPALASGDWVTRHLLNNGGNIPAISHFSASLTPSAPVPEPSTLLILGAGLCCIAGTRGLKKKK
ncbi:MAG: PEP-CTERM sorting domain-containing protein [Thermodesulfobacteriota bacterium]|nr:PEP-CTERM sorting domain-containing protein [Thermodesulfobacteriota bacterium]